MRKLLILSLALVAVLGIAASASARSRDRNHDRLPDRWERAHHLSLKVKQARRDQDRDGLNNRGEFRARTNPRDADTDNDGINDGDENAGTISKFENGVLTITLAQGGELSATVDDNTEIECHGAHASHDSGDDDNSGPGGDDGPNHEAGDDQGDDNHEQGDDDNEQGDDDEVEDSCGTDALTAGTRVREAELKATSSGKRWEELELVK